MKEPQKSPADEKKEKPKKDPLDEKLENLERQVLAQLKSEHVRPDFRGEFFSNKQLNDLREVLE